jgi:N-formylglutamate amidohydrolase
MVTEALTPCVIHAPTPTNAAVVCASPHSGRDYPEGFLRASALAETDLRRSEDGYVDRIFSAAPRLGAPLLCALFPRTYVDANREPFELDPSMFEEALPTFANTRSPRVAAGLGTIPRVIAGGAEIYGGKLRVAEALGRIERCYRPYHRALADLMANAKARHGYAILLDCHSMPSAGGPADTDGGRTLADVVLGDGFGATCASALIDAVHRLLADRGYRVERNSPYAGGFTTRNYGRPQEGIHALQIELNRALYMNETTLELSPGWPRLREDMEAVVAVLTDPQAMDFAPT